MQTEMESIEQNGLKLIESSVEDIDIMDSGRGPQVQGVCLGRRIIILSWMKQSRIFFIMPLVSL